MNMDASPLSPEEFDYLSTLLRQRSGLALSADKGYLIETRLAPVARAHGFAGVRALVQAIRRGCDEALVYLVVESMTTNESMFFRDTKPFDHLKQVILPAMKAEGRKHLRIWSAACSTGQEAYSAAIILREEAAKYPGLVTEIIGTDLAEKVIERAIAGVFSQFEVQRGLPIAYLMKYFEQRPGNQWEVKPDIKAMVRFSTGNLLASFAALGKFDVVFCRNVLIYFDEKNKSDVLDRLAQIVNRPGYLILGGSESVFGLTQKWAPFEPHRGLYRLS